MSLNKPVNFPTAKLLKEKGYSLECIEFYFKGKRDKKFTLQTGVEYESDRDCVWDWNLNGGKSGNLSKIIPYPNFEGLYYSAPIIADVVCWIYTKYNIWIQISILRDNEWHYSIRRKENNWEIEFPTKEKFSSIEKAYEKGIEIVLNTYSPTI